MDLKLWLKKLGPWAGVYIAVKWTVLGGGAALLGWWNGWFGGGAS